MVTANLAGKPFELLRDRLLFARIERVVHLAQVAVDDVANGEVVGAVRQVIATAHGWALRAQVHLQMLEEVVVLEIMCNVLSKQKLRIIKYSTCVVPRVT